MATGWEALQELEASDPRTLSDSGRAALTELRSAHAAGQLSGAPPPTDPTSSTTVTPASRRQPGLLERGEAGIADVARPIAAAIGRLGEGAAMTSPTELRPGRRPMPSSSEVLTDTRHALGDLATAVGAATFPAGVAAEMAGNAGARMLGAPAPEARRVGQGASLALAGGKLLEGGIDSVRRWTASRSLEAAMGPTSETGDAAALARSKIPAASRELARQTQARYFAPVEEYLGKTGAALAPGTPEADQLLTTLKTSAERWAGMGGDSDHIQSLIDKLEGAATMKGGVAAVERAPEAITAQDLFDAKRFLGNISGKSRPRMALGAIDEALNTLIRDTPVEETWREGLRVWGKQVAPARDLANAVGRAKTPGMAMRLLTRGEDAPYRSELASQLFGGESEDWQRVLRGIKTLETNRGWRRFEDYAAHRAMTHALLFGPAEIAGGIASGRPLTGIGAALATVAIAGGARYAGHVASFLGGAVKNPAAAGTVARALGAWAADQDPAVQGAATDLSTALTAGQGGAPEQVSQRTDGAPNMSSILQGLP